MAQQINLCAPQFRPRRERFGAATVLRLMAISLVLAGAGVGAGVWQFKKLAAEHQAMLNSQGAEVKRLKDALTQARTAAGPVAAGLAAQLQQRRASVQQREQMLEAIQRGLFQPGETHSDRLAQLALSVPESVWLTQVKADGAQFLLEGFTLDPAALNEWVPKLAQQSALRRYRLASVKVDYKPLSSTTAGPSGTAGAQGASPAATTAPPASLARPVWAFSLVNSDAGTLPVPAQQVVAADSSAKGAL